MRGQQSRPAPAKRNYNSQHTPGPDKRRGRVSHSFLIDVRDGHSVLRRPVAPPMAGERRRALSYAAAGPGVAGERCRPGAPAWGWDRRPGAASAPPGPPCLPCLPCPSEALGAAGGRSGVGAGQPRPAAGGEGQAGAEGSGG